MKKTAVAIAVTLTGFATAAQAVPNDNTWYMGGKLGWSQFHDTRWYNSELNNNGQTRKSQLSIGAFSGYQVNSYISLEMGYDRLGRMLYKGDTVNGAFKAQGVQLTTKLNYPINNDLNMYARLGGMVWHASSNHNIAGKKHDTDTSQIFAGGMEWIITREISTRLEYQWINNIGEVKTIGIRPDNGMISIGMSYRFGQQKTDLSISPKTIPTSETQNKRFTLKSDVLFNFNNAALKPDSQKTLDQLYCQMTHLDPKDSSITVLGFADRIGPDTYNQDLSEKRAQSVVNYLLSNGIQSNKISARGMGKSSSVTSNSCDNVKTRDALINCLAPDRRVEIEVKGIKDIAIHPTK